MSRQLCGICMCPYDEQDGSCGCTEVNQECNSMEMNKPVAWIDKNTGKPRMEGFIQTEYDIPLYTHQLKELSDVEILEVWRENERVYPMDRSRLLDRTRACIKKASEK